MYLRETAVSLILILEEMCVKLYVSKEEACMPMTIIHTVGKRRDC